MSNELESDGAMVEDLELLGPMTVTSCWSLCDRDLGSRQVRQTRSEDHVSGHSDCHSVRFLLERGLRSRNLQGLVFADMT
jgi:hypothetical protein